MSASASILSNGKHYAVTPDQKIPEGEWLISAIADGQPAHWLTLREEGASQPARPGSSNGTLRRVVSPGRYTIGWNGKPGSKTSVRVTVQCVKAAIPRQRNAILGLCIGHQARERNAIDEEGLRISRFVSMVSSDWLRPDAFSLNFDAEIDAARWQRQHLPPGAHLNVRGPNLWSSRRWSSLDVADWQAWANAAVDSGFAVLVDSFAGPNEPNGSAYSGDPDRDTTAGRARINAGWNAAAKILRERTGKPVATPSYAGAKSLDYTLEAIRQCTNCNAVDIHPYNWTRRHFETLHAVAGDRIIFATEFGVQSRYRKSDGTDDIEAQANANRRELPMIREGVDFGSLFEWRNPRQADDASNTFMGAYTRTGQRRGAMYDFAVQMVKPRVIVRDCVWSTKRTQRPYVPIVPGAQRIIGIRPEDAAQIANIRTLVAPSDPVYVDHFAKPHATLDERNAALASILPGIAAAGPVVLYDTIRRYDLTGVGGTESVQREQNDRTMRTLGQWLYGVGLSLYCFDSTTPAYVTADVREAVRISNGKPVVGFVSPHWQGRSDKGLVPLDTYRAYVRAAIDAGASEIVVWAHVGDAEPSTLAGYVQVAIDEANR